MTILRKIAFVTIAAGTTVVIGWFVGLGLGAIWNSDRDDGARDRLQRRLESSIQGIRQGAVFPELTLWDLEGTQAIDARELLPSGGLLLLVSPGCADCIDDVVGLSNACKATDFPVENVLIVGSEVPESQILAGEMAEAGVTLRLYTDVQQALHRVHRVSSTPTYFLFDDDGIVLSIGTGKRKSGEFEEMLHSFKAHGKGL